MKKDALMNFLKTFESAIKCPFESVANGEILGLEIYKASCDLKKYSLINGLDFSKLNKSLWSKDYKLVFNVTATLLIVDLATYDSATLVENKVATLLNVDLDIALTASHTIEEGSNLRKFITVLNLQLAICLYDKIDNVVMDLSPSKTLALLKTSPDSEVKLVVKKSNPLVLNLIVEEQTNQVSLAELSYSEIEAGLKKLNKVTYSVNGELAGEVLLGYDLWAVYGVADHLLKMNQLKSKVYQELSRKAGSDLRYSYLDIMFSKHAKYDFDPTFPQGLASAASISVEILLNTFISVDIHLNKVNSKMYGHLSARHHSQSSADSTALLELSMLNQQIDPFTNQIFTHWSY